MLGIPQELIDRAKSQPTTSSVTVDELFIVSKALEKAIAQGVFTKEELQVVGKAWNKQLCECEIFLRQQKINAFIAAKDKPKATTTTTETTTKTEETTKETKKESKVSFEEPVKEAPKEHHHHHHHKEVQVRETVKP